MVRQCAFQPSRPAWLLVVRAWDGGFALMAEREVDGSRRR